MPLKPFAYPLPETRFLHAGGIVYKFKIRYGNFIIPSLFWFFQEAIRVILGNLDDLHPFSTDHFTIFPYLSKWERVSEMRFEHKNVDLVPYPYICTMYLELNSFQQSLSLGKSAWLCLGHFLNKEVFFSSFSVSVHCVLWVPHPCSHSRPHIRYRAPSTARLLPDSTPPSRASRGSSFTPIQGILKTLFIQS
uniref:Uncharacterized protein n=1 Tax=Coturnix japonica TaxID=93934 RepID=A0A8C2TW63_COTJA